METKFSRRIQMRKVLLASLLCTLASAVIAATGEITPLNVKTGLWQVTSTSSASGDMPALPPEVQAKLGQMSPEQRAKIEEAMKSKLNGTPQTSTYKKCLTKEDLTKNAFGKPDDKCTWTVLTSTGTDMDVKGTLCDVGKSSGLASDIHIKFHVVDSENVQASAHGSATGNGRTTTIDGTYAAKWLGASCPADTK
jgi:hypothetical protein